MPKTLKTSGFKSLPVRARINRYEHQATKLRMAYRASLGDAIHRIRQYHPRLAGRANTNDRNSVTLSDLAKAGFNQSDARCVVARWHGFENWRSLTRHVVQVNRRRSPVAAFELAVEAIITGKEATLTRLLKRHPDLVRARSTRWHRATLLHYVSANGVEDFRQRTPLNIVAIANILLAAGAEVDADLDYGPEGSLVYPERKGSTTLGLAATSYHPAVARVQIALLELLIQAGASVDGLSGGWNPVIAALHNGRGEAAEFLAGKGARLDLEAAAGTGRLKAVKSYFGKTGLLGSKATRTQLEMGCQWACEYGHTDVVAFLLRQKLDVSATPHGETGMHWACFGGHADIVKLLLDKNAPLELRDQRFRATPLKWALQGWCYPPPEAVHGRYHEVVGLLVRAGANPHVLAELNQGQREKLAQDSLMRTLLGADNSRTV